MIVVSMTDFPTVKNPFTALEGLAQGMLAQRMTPF